MVPMMTYIEYNEDRQTDIDVGVGMVPFMTYIEYNEERQTVIDVGSWDGSNDDLH